MQRTQAGKHSRGSGEVQQWIDVIRPKIDEGDIGEDKGLMGPLAPRGGGEHSVEEMQRTRVKLISRGSKDDELIKVKKATTVMSEEDLIFAREGICPELIESVMKTARSMFSPEDNLCEESLIKLIVEAVNSTDGNYGVQEAVKWANGYEFPEHLVDSDLRLL